MSGLKSCHTSHLQFLSTSIVYFDCNKTFVCKYVSKWQIMINNFTKLEVTNLQLLILTRMWANAQRDGRPAEHRWRPLFNAAKFG